MRPTDTARAFLLETESVERDGQHLLITTALFRQPIDPAWIAALEDNVESTVRLDAFAARVGLRHGIAVPTGSAALDAAVVALRLGPSDEVIPGGQRASSGHLGLTGSRLETRTTFGTRRTPSSFRPHRP